MPTALPMCWSMLGTFVIVFLVFWTAALLGAGGAVADKNLVERESKS